MESESRTRETRAVWALKMAVFFDTGRSVKFVMSPRQICIIFLL